MNILITGATGFVGSALLPKLLTEHRVIAIVRDRALLSPVLRTHESLIVVEYSEGRFVGPIKDVECDMVIHLASHLTSASNADAINDLADANIVFGNMVLSEINFSKLKYFVNVGSFSEYHDNSETLSPTYLYSAYKSAFRHIIAYYQAIYGFKVINVNLYTVYGDISRQRKAIDLIIDSLNSHDLINMSPGLQKFDFIHVDDVVQFFAVLPGQVEKVQDTFTDFHLGTGIGTTLRELASIIATHVGREPQIKWGALPYRVRDTMTAIAPVESLIQTFQWRPSTDINAGVLRYLKKKGY